MTETALRIIERRLTAMAERAYAEREKGEGDGILQAVGVVREVLEAPVQLLVCVEGEPVLGVQIGEEESVATTGERTALDHAIGLKRRRPDSTVSIVVTLADESL